MRKAFTLIELIVVVCIIIALAALLAPLCVETGATHYKYDVKYLKYADLHGYTTTNDISADSDGFVHTTAGMIPTYNILVVTENPHYDPEAE